MELEKRKLKPTKVKNNDEKVKKFVKAGKFLKSWKTFLKSWEKKKELEPAEDKEECTFPEGFVKNQMVRICSDAARLTCGVEGSLESVCEGIAQIVADTGGRFQAGVADIIPVKDLKPFQKCRALRQMRDADRRTVLVDAGFHKELKGADRWGAVAEELKGTGAVQLQLVHVRVWCSWLKWTFEGKLKVNFVDPQLIHSWYCRQISAACKGDLQLQKQWSAISSAVQEDCVALFPVWSAGHWTLFVVDVVQQECRYYDSLQEQVVGNWECADKIMQTLCWSTHAADFVPLEAP